jgi:hypothetical protein
MENIGGYIILGALLIVTSCAVFSLAYVLHLAGVTWYVVGFVVGSYVVGKLYGCVRAALGEGKE